MADTQTGTRTGQGDGSQGDGQLARSYQGGDDTGSSSGTGSSSSGGSQGSGRGSFEGEAETGHHGGIR